MAGTWTVRWSARVSLVRGNSIGPIATAPAPNGLLVYVGVTDGTVRVFQLVRASLLSLLYPLPRFLAFAVHLCGSYPGRTCGTTSRISPAGCHAVERGAAHGSRVLEAHV